jgi:hypothetical protein
VSSYRLAIDRTTKTIERRARCYRNLIVTVVLLTLGLIAWSVIVWTWSPLSGLLFLFPICGFFFFFDQKLLADWRSQLVDEWIKKEIDFSNFCEAVSAIPMLPKDTLCGMLATLPRVRDVIAEQGMAPSTREAAAAAVLGTYACESDLLALKTVGATIASGSIVIAAGSHMWEPLLGGFGLVLIPILEKCLKRRRIAILKERTFTARAKVDFNIEKYDQLVSGLRWGPILMSEKDGTSKLG